MNCTLLFGPWVTYNYMGTQGHPYLDKKSKLLNHSGSWKMPCLHIQHKCLLTWLSSSFCQTDPAAKGFRMWSPSHDSNFHTGWTKILSIIVWDRLHHMHGVCKAHNLTPTISPMVFNNHISKDIVMTLCSFYVSVWYFQKTYVQKMKARKFMKYEQ